MLSATVMKRPYLKQKPRLYFDENFPERVISHFSTHRYWKKKIKAISSITEGNSGRSDRFHYLYSQRHGYTLVTLDYDFNNDCLFPFTNGHMPGIIIVCASSSNVRQIIDVPARLLAFLLMLPLPNAFLTETKFIGTRHGATIRGRDASTREIKCLRVRAGQTTTRDVRQFFSF